MRFPRKAAVIAFQSASQDVISQASLQKMAQHQEAEWLANRATTEAASTIERRLLRGAVIEDGSLTFDRKLKMARSKQGRGQTG